MDLAGVVSETTPVMLNCPKHGRYSGWQVSIGDRVIGSTCDHCAEEERQAELAELSKRIQVSQKRDVFNNSCIPPRFTGKSFRDFHPRSDDERRVKSVLERYVSGFEMARREGTSFLFVGPTGVGKTHLAAAVANNVMLLGYSAVYVSCLNYLSRIKRAWNPGESSSEDELIESFVGYDLLVLDELGKGTLDQKEKGMIFRLIDRRYEENRPTIGISKFPEQRVVELIDDDAVRRLKAGGGGTLVFNWPAYE